MNLAQLINELGTMQSKAYAWEVLDKEGERCREYCDKYIARDNWGKMTWHAVLFDAIRLRKILAEHNINPNTPQK